MKLHYYLAMILLALRMTAGAASYVGDNNNNTFFLSGNGHLGQFTATLVNPYSGMTVSVDAEKYINDSYYDGMGGTDSVYGTAYGDVVMLTDALGNQMIRNIETLSFGSGGDIVILSDDTIILGNLTLLGGAADDIIWSNAGSDYLDGYIGNDFIDGGPGDDWLMGGSDNDTFSYKVGYGLDYIDGGSGFNIIELLGVSAADILITPNVTISHILAGTVTGYQITAPGFDVNMLAVNVEQIHFDDGTTMQVPEPASMVLLIIGCGLLRKRIA